MKLAVATSCSLSLLLVPSYVLVQLTNVVSADNGDNFRCFPDPRCSPPKANGRWRVNCSATVREELVWIIPNIGPTFWNQTEREIFAADVCTSYNEVFGCNDPLQKFCNAAVVNDQFRVAPGGRRRLGDPNAPTATPTDISPAECNRCPSCTPGDTVNQDGSCSPSRRLAAEPAMAPIPSRQPATSPDERRLQTPTMYETLRTTVISNSQVRGVDGDLGLLSDGAVLLTFGPTTFPSSEPSDVPSEKPSDVPSEKPSDVPSEKPSDVPSTSPSPRPTPTPNNPESSSEE